VPGWFYLVSALVFCAKTFAFVNVVIWIRWTFPRIRVDQMMTLCWKYLVPIGMVAVVLAAGNEWLSFNLWGEAAKGQAPLFTVRGLMHGAFFAVFGLLPFVIFLRKTFKNIALTGERVDMSNW
jgi:NADH-quinone oxidoreductase subunit H